MRSKKKSLIGTVGYWKEQGVDTFVVICNNLDCERKGKVNIESYPDSLRTEAFKNALYCKVCRAQGRPDKELDVRPQFAPLNGPGIHNQNQKNS